MWQIYKVFFKLPNLLLYFILFFCLNLYLNIKQKNLTMQKRKINLIIKCLKKKDNLKIFLEHITSEEINEVHLEYIKFNLDNIKKKWLSQKSTSLPSLLVEEKYIENCFNKLTLFQDEVKVMIFLGLIEPKNILFWGSNYDENNNKLSKTKWRLLKDLDKNHIKKILSLYGENKMSYLYEKTLKELLN